MASTEYPSTCPKCGSREFEEVESFINPESIRAELGFYYDRKCTACGTRYPPPVPLWAAVVIISLCIPFLPLFILLIYKAVDLFRKGLRCIRRQGRAAERIWLMKPKPSHHLRYFDHQPSKVSRVNRIG